MTILGILLFSSNFSQEFILHTDASTVGLTTILSQDFEGEEHLVLYVSRKLFLREKSYSISDKEVLTVRWVVNSLRYYLLGSPFFLITGHIPLCWIHTTRDMNPCMMRWCFTLQAYGF